VTFVIGNTHNLNFSLLEPGTSIAATLANEFAEAYSPMYVSALIALGLVLFMITFVVLVLARMLLARLNRMEGKATA
jgi:phosphate transport system permease protein